MDMHTQGDAIVAYKLVGDVPCRLSCLFSTCALCSSLLSSCICLQRCSSRTLDSSHGLRRSSNSRKSTCILLLCSCVHVRQQVTCMVQRLRPCRNVPAACRGWGGLAAPCPQCRSAGAFLVLFTLGAVSRLRYRAPVQATHASKNTKDVELTAGCTARQSFNKVDRLMRRHQDEWMRMSDEQVDARLHQAYRRLRGPGRLAHASKSLACACNGPDGCVRCGTQMLVHTSQHHTCRAIT